MINLFTANLNKESTEETKNDIINFAESHSIAVTTLDLKTNPNSFVNLAKHFGRAKII